LEAAQLAANGTLQWKDGMSENGFIAGDFDAEEGVSSGRFIQSPRFHCH
jgi:hypothetical protein